MGKKTVNAPGVNITDFIETLLRIRVLNIAHISSLMKSMMI